jgi:hypothetical protein
MGVQKSNDGHVFFVEFKLGKNILLHLVQVSTKWGLIAKKVVTIMTFLIHPIKVVDILP